MRRSKEALEEELRAQAGSRQEGARTQEQGDEGEHTQEAAAAAERRERIRAVLAAHIVSCSPEPPSPQGGHMPQCAHEAQDHGAQHEAAVVQPEPESVPQVQHQAEEQAAPKEVERGSAAQAYLQGLRAAQQHVNIKTVEARLVRVPAEPQHTVQQLVQHMSTHHGVCSTTLVLSHNQEAVQRGSTLAELGIGCTGEVLCSNLCDHGTCSKIHSA
eukprot:TRINITY_DN3912_c0_g1_i4.p2 TRINITY_DN3912_c0_g1~~TRINITY_DN3912_c0_g1_i4.p2  ORF type:complete len:215 (-),score=79.32 TRINITY_DN3912_c0_g1_i4:88-732(-)